MTSRFQMQTCLWVGWVPSSLIEMSPLMPQHQKQPLLEQRLVDNFVEPNK